MMEHCPVGSSPELGGCLLGRSMRIKFLPIQPDVPAVPWGGFSYLWPLKTWHS